VPLAIARKLSNPLPPKYLTTAEVNKGFAVHGVQTVNPIARLEKAFRCKITGVLSAIPTNGNGSFSVTLSTLQRAGIKSEISTSLDVDSLKSLGWVPSQPKPAIPQKRRPKASDFWTPEVKAKVAAVKAPNVPLPDNKASASFTEYAFANYNWKLLHVCLRSMKGRLARIGIYDTDLVKQYYRNKYGVASLGKLSEFDVAKIAAEVQAMSADETIFAKRTAEIKKALTRKHESRDYV